MWQSLYQVSYLTSPYFLMICDSIFFSIYIPLKIRKKKMNMWINKLRMNNKKSSQYCECIYTHIHIYLYPYLYIYIYMEEKSVKAKVPGSPKGPT